MAVEPMVTLALSSQVTQLHLYPFTIPAYPSAKPTPMANAMATQVVDPFGCLNPHERLHSCIRHRSLFQ